MVLDLAVDTGSRRIRLISVLQLLLDSQECVGLGQLGVFDTHLSIHLEAWALIGCTLVEFESIKRQSFVDEFDAE
eukprot:scaffold180850_cov50-Attheya_sp.AAC.1